MEVALSSTNNFENRAGALHVNCELDELGADELLGVLTDYIHQPDNPTPVLDLSDVSFVPSYHIPGLRTAAEGAKRMGETLTIRARKSTKVMLSRMGVDSLANLSVFEPPH